MTEPTPPLVVHVPAEDAFDEDGVLVVPDAPDGYSSEVIITVHAEVRDAEGNLIQSTDPEVQRTIDSLQ